MRFIHFLLPQDVTKNCAENHQNPFSRPVVFRPLKCGHQTGRKPKMKLSCLLLLVAVCNHTGGSKVPEFNFAIRKLLFESLFVQIRSVVTEIEPLVSRAFWMKNDQVTNNHSSGHNFVPGIARAVRFAALHRPGPRLSTVGRQAPASPTASNSGQLNSIFQLQELKKIFTVRPITRVCDESEMRFFHFLLPQDVTKNCAENLF